MAEFEENVDRKRREFETNKRRVVNEMVEQVFMEREELDNHEFDSMRRLGIEVMGEATRNKEEIVRFEVLFLSVDLDGAPPRFDQAEFALDVAVYRHSPPRRIRRL